MIELRHGDRSFSALTEGEGPAVLCVHGFPDHFHSFRHQLPALAQAGYRAIAPMLRGYEPSSQLRRHVPDFHPLQVAGDLVAWARELGGGEPIHLVGHDWGAVATYLACALEPSLFRSATTIAVPPLGAMQAGIRRYPVQLRNSSYMLFFQLRGLADRVVQRRDFAFVEGLWRRWSPGWAWDPEDMDSLKRSFREPGVVWSALAYYRAMLNPFLEDSREVQRLGNLPSGVPTLAITGALDGCMDTRIYDCVDASTFPEGYRMERIQGAGHFAHQEKPEEVNRLMLEWIAKH
ncbi:MAG: alpha/beta hydrolase [Deltaproteobacteria bacterium]|nr:alpha/beta hydrolase [Deltaproteobacteria bacterium]MBW2394306.1 alpha/beta hydrolase [Deltaproteobacteria bacterium]